MILLFQLLFIISLCYSKIRVGVFCLLVLQRKKMGGGHGCWICNVASSSSAAPSSATCDCRIMTDEMALIPAPPLLPPPPAAAADASPSPPLPQQRQNHHHHHRNRNLHGHDDDDGPALPGGMLMGVPGIFGLIGRCPFQCSALPFAVPVHAKLKFKKFKCRGRGHHHGHGNDCTMKVNLKMKMKRGRHLLRHRAEEVHGFAI